MHVNPIGDEAPSLRQTARGISLTSALPTAEDMVIDDAFFAEMGDDTGEAVTAEHGQKHSTQPEELLTPSGGMGPVVSV